MIRVGDTYYIANSTFEWFPGVRLHESKDMVHWNLLPSPLSRTSQLDMRGNPSSGGIWLRIFPMRTAILADLHGREGRERCVQGLHELFGHCRSIHGPWSEPIRVNGVGFDASLFHDDDGRKYLVQQTWDFVSTSCFDGITLTEFDVKTIEAQAGN